MRNFIKKSIKIKSLLIELLWLVDKQNKESIGDLAKTGFRVTNEYNS